MGVSPSKKVHQTLLTSSTFTSTCTTTYTDSLTLSQSQGILPYQLYPTSLRLHQSLISTCPLIDKWAPDPPSRLHVDSAYKSLRRTNHRTSETLDSAEFRDFAAVLFTNVVVENAGKAVLSRVPVGIVGIAGVAVVAKVGRGFVATAVGAYALGVATSVYLSLG
ncbi:uncharacterized protein LOC141608466 [Silene latifolia]|uniref:uncharacterized protein LOC141608466 n=1 Tax=Silene latifolia TaxID=37657 RepID=UPI003D780665